MNKILRVFLNTDMRCNHLGLKKVAEEHKINLDRLREGEHVCFINRTRTMLKVYSKNDIISFMKSPKGQPIDLRVLELIPKAFQTKGGFTYTKLLRKSLASRFARPVDKSGAPLRYLH